jgi:hypothetical protein
VFERFHRCSQDPPAGFELAVASAPGGSGSRLRNLDESIAPFVGLRSGPYQYESLNDVGQGRPLPDEKDARTLSVRFKEVAEVPRHRPEIGSNKNPIPARSEGEHLGVGDSFQPGLMGRKKIDRRFAAETPGDNGMVETGVRQEANHVSFGARWFAAAYARRSF